MSNLLDKISAEYNDEMQKPEDGFTCQEFADNNEGMSRQKAYGILESMVEGGKLKRKKAGIHIYYYE